MMMTTVAGSSKEVKKGSLLTSVATFCCLKKFKERKSRVEKPLLSFSSFKPSVLAKLNLAIAAHRPLVVVVVVLPSLIATLNLICLSPFSILTP